MRLLVLLLALAASAAAQTADPNPPWAYDPIGVGNARAYVGTWPPSPETPQTVYERTDAPASLVIDGETWVIRRTQRFRENADGPGWARSESRVLVRYDTVSANVLVRDAPDRAPSPLYPCRLDTPVEEADAPVPCGDVWTSATYPDDSRERDERSFEYLAGRLTLEAGVGEVGEEVKGGYGETLVYAVVVGDTLGAYPEGYPSTRIDPTPAWRYVPLALGNVWEYRIQDGQGVRYRQHSITAGREIDGVRYLGSSHCEAEAGQAYTCTLDETPIRYDTLAARVVTPDGFAFEPEACSFDEPAHGSEVSEPVICEPTLQRYAVAEDRTVDVEGDRIETRVRSFPSFSSDVAFPVYAAGIGLVGLDGGPNPMDSYRLTYARLVRPDGSVVEVGRRYTDAEGGPEARPLTLSASPNPAGELLALRLGGASGPVTVEVFDALGRRVLRAETTSPRLAVEAGAWAPGVYLVRATDGARQAVARVVRR